MENTHIKNEETTSVTSNSETATVAASSSTENTTVTSGGGGSENNNPTPSGFQPFEQLHEAVLAAVNSHGMPPGFMAAAAAAAAELVSNSNNDGDQPMLDLQPMPEVDYVKKESVRASNRERKKKWRIHNEERNKDNDLRCRVNKRANKLYGPGDNEAKQKWIQDEFEKRRQKRMDKERRKHIVNNVLSVPGSGNPNNNDGNVQLGNIGTDQMSNYYTPLPQIDTDTADKLLNFPTDLQRQLLEQLNNSMLALANGMQQSSTTSQSEEDNNSNSNNNNNNNENNDSNQVSTFTTNSTATNEQIQQAITQGLSSNTSATSSEHNSPMVAMNTPAIESDMAAPTDNDELASNTVEIKEEKKPEYPMDAVLTLMQLNAGWRQ
ncbi:hypothetical protein INT47_009608 [Mucor saturninus]|uniref:DUF3020 domain-containing protein n=1 Tax=Mucor saturninus TaxID=64648 RepID=A0A8H7QQ23_9FUNG|nr:hypothetical protein INT47_009608 [Mucor saturninus]